MTEIEGKVPIITGGGTGVGRGIALALGGAGANAVLCGRRLEPLAVKDLDGCREV